MGEDLVVREIDDDPALSAAPARARALLARPPRAIRCDVRLDRSYNLARIGSLLPIGVQSGR
jgi:hypothetical protein